MNKETLISFLNSADNTDLILIYVFEEPYQFIKQSINYDIKEEDKTLAIQRDYDKRIFLINMDNIKSITTMSEKEYGFTNPQCDGVIV